MFVVVAVCTIGLFACGSSKKKAADASASPYVIGFMSAETGVNASPIRHNAIELAVEDINKAGGINGHPVKYTAYDAGVGTDPNQTVTAVQKAISDKVNAIVGMGATAQVKAVAPLLGPTGIPTLHFAQNPSIDFSKLGPAQGANLFRTGGRADIFAQAMGEYIASTKPASVGMLVGTDENSAFVGKAIKQTLTKAGITNIVERDVSPTATDLTEAVLALKPTAVTLQWGFPQMDALFQKQALQNGLTQQTYCSQSCGSLFTQNLNSPAELKNIQFLSSCDSDVLTTKEAKNYVTEYRAKYPDQKDKDTAGSQPTIYDDMFILKTAADKAKSIDNKAIVDQLNKMDYTGVCGQYKTDNEHNMAHFTQLIDATGGPTAKKLIKNFGGLTGVDVQP
jgi:branched-chain amino acid transport system substrate-binding protein